MMLSVIEDILVFRRGRGGGACFFVTPELPAVIEILVVVVTLVVVVKVLELVGCAGGRGGRRGVPFVVKEAGGIESYCGAWRETSSNCSVCTRSRMLVTVPFS